MDVNHQDFYRLIFFRKFINTSTFFQLGVESWTLIIRQTNHPRSERTVIDVVCSKLVVRTLVDGIYVRVSMGTLVEASSIDLSF